MRETDRNGQPTEMAELSELKEKVAEALLSLGEERRKLLVLTHFRGMRYQEVADGLMEPVPIGTIRSRTFMGRRNLRENKQLRDYLEHTA